MVGVGGMKSVDPGDLGLRLLGTLSLWLAGPTATRTGLIRTLCPCGCGFSPSRSDFSGIELYV